MLPYIAAPWIRHGILDMVKTGGFHQMVMIDAKICFLEAC